MVGRLTHSSFACAVFFRFKDIQTALPSYTTTYLHTYTYTRHTHLHASFHLCSHQLNRHFSSITDIPTTQARGKILLVWLPDLHAKSTSCRDTHRCGPSAAPQRNTDSLLGGNPSQALLLDTFPEGSAIADYWPKNPTIEWPGIIPRDHHSPQKAASNRQHRQPKREKKEKKSLLQHTYSPPHDTPLCWAPIARKTFSCLDDNLPSSKGSSFRRSIVTQPPTPSCPHRLYPGFFSSRSLKLQIPRLPPSGPSPSPHLDPKGLWTSYSQPAFPGLDALRFHLELP